MPDFNYTAKSIEGKTIKGSYEASDKNEVTKMLRQKGFFPTIIEQQNKSKDVAEFGLLNKVKIKDIAVFCRQFATLASAGLPLVNILDLLSKQTSNHLLKKELAEVAEDVQTGNSLSESLKRKKSFPTLLVSMVEVGETGGTLDTVLTSMAEHYEKEAKLKQKIRAAMTYPIIVLVITFGVVYFLLTSVVPVFVGMFVDVGIDLPLPTRLLLNLSSFFVANGLWLILSLIIFVILFRYAVAEGNGRYFWHKTLLKLPLFKKLIIFVLSASFTRAMAMLLSAGVPLIDALSMAKKVLSNAVAEKALVNISGKVRLGEPLWISIEQESFFPMMVSHMTRVGEESGSLDNVLTKTAIFFEEESEAYVLKLTTLMEPALILVLGIIVAFVVLSIALPMFEMMGMIS